MQGYAYHLVSSEQRTENLQSALQSQGTRAIKAGRQSRALLGLIQFLDGCVEGTLVSLD